MPGGPHATTTILVGRPPPGGCLARTRSLRDEGNPSGWRERLSPLSPDAVGQQATAAGLRQAGYLLSAIRPDVGRDSRYPGHQHAARRAADRGTARRRRTARAITPLHGTAGPRRDRPGVSDRRGVHRPRPRLPCPRRQYLLRTRPRARAGGLGTADGRGARVRLSCPRPGAIWRGRVRSELPRREPRRETEAAALQLGRDGALLLRWRGGRGCARAEAVRTRGAGDYRCQPPLPAGGQVDRDA